jgi:hypothetical protein
MLRKMSVKKPLHKVMAFMIAILFSAIMGIGQGSAKADGRPACGADILVFDIVDSVSASRVMVLGESTFPGVYEVLVDMGDSIEFGLMCEIEQPGPQRCPVFSVSIMF